MKRYYDNRGRSAPAWFMRPMLVMAFPIILCWAMTIEILSGFYRAWLEARIQWVELKILWRSAREPGSAAPMPWCEQCQGYHHITADHIYRSDKR